jgi:putative transposase
VLRRPELSAIVAESLLKFDGERYELTDFVVMPNHVHVLAAFPDEDSMLRQCDSWKHFTGREIHRTLGRRGKFWQQDGFDHLVRSIEQFTHLRRYIAENPRKARLRPDEYRHYSKEL